MGYWKFAAPLQIGDTVIFEDMIHYNHGQNQHV